MGKLKKVVCIVQARMGSSRLPGKVMKPILGEPMIGYTLKRLRRCETVSEIILATSDMGGDDELASYVGGAGIVCFRGSEDNVLERYVLANRESGGDIVIRVTGDCPLIDPYVVDLAVKVFQSGDADYLSTGDGAAIRGSVAEVFSAEALEKTYAIVSELEAPGNYKEHVTIYMYRHPQEFKIESISAGEWFNRPYRLCVDEIDDFRLIDTIFNYFKNPYPSTKEVVEFLDSHPEIAFINKHVKQKKA